MADPFEGFSGLSPLVKKNGKTFNNYKQLSKNLDPNPFNSMSIDNTNADALGLGSNSMFGTINNNFGLDSGKNNSVVANISSKPAAETSVSNAWAQSPARNADGSFVSPSTSSTSLSDLGNPNLVTDAFASKSSPMSYLGETWDKISGGADSFGSWMKDTFGAKQANRDYNQYLTNNPKTDTFTPMTANEFAANANKEQELNNQQWGYGVQAGLGLGNLGLGVMSYLDKSAYNDKAMNLMDQQLANNNDLMSTRKARAADISKAFGSGSAQTI